MQQSPNFAFAHVMVYPYLPLMLLLLRDELEKSPPTLDEAMMDLRSRTCAIFRDMTQRQSIRGIIADSMLVSIPAAGHNAAPKLYASPTGPYGALAHISR